MTFIKFVTKIEIMIKIAEFVQLLESLLFGDVQSKDMLVDVVVSHSIFRRYG